MPIIFTQHLYIKEEVGYALLSAILLKEKDVALFWAFELFYSGFETEVFDYIWNIYYNFHASLSPSFEKYFIRKLSDTSIGHPLILASIVTNLCSKPYTTDVYILSQKGVHGSTQEPSFKTWFETKDYISIASYIMHESFNPNEIDMDNIREIALTHHGIKWYRPMLVPSPNICLKMRFLSHIMQICISRVYVISANNRFNLSSDHIMVPHGPIPYLSNKDVLKRECKYAINCSQMLHLFDLERHKEGHNALVQMYRENWLNHCTKTPYWLKKIAECNGTVNVETDILEFPNIEQEELFYEKYGLEPDEQSLEVQHASIEPIILSSNDSDVEFRARFGTWNIATR